MDYKEAGVDIDAGNALVDKIKPMVKATSRTGASTDIGGFGGLFDLAACKFNDPVLVAATDGVGTKLSIAFATNKHHTVGIDLVAMCVNDLIVQGAEPLFFLDYFATGGLEIDQAAEVVQGIAEGCKQAGCALIGGETAEMPGLYAKGHYDLAGFAIGAVEREQVLPKGDIRVGDVVLGLTSSGIHSNGFSLVRHIISHQGLDYQDPAPFDTSRTLGGALLTPTRIYVPAILEAIKTHHVKALAHITGGGLLENIPRILPAELGVDIDTKSWERPEVFTWLEEAGNVATEEMFRTFNNGIGMVIIIAKEHVDTVKAALTQHGETVNIIGKVSNQYPGAVRLD